jgi:hypothetical protein
VRERVRERGRVDARHGVELTTFAGLGVSARAHAYGSIDWSMTAYASLHVVTLLLIAGFMWVLALGGHFGPGRYTGLQDYDDWRGAPPSPKVVPLSAVLVMTFNLIADLLAATLDPRIRL